MALIGIQQGSKGKMSKKQGIHKNKTRKQQENVEGKGHS